MGGGSTPAEDPHERPPNGGFYEAPEGLGPLTIVEECDMILTLEAEDARRVRFDTLRRAWVDPAP